MNIGKYFGCIVVRYTAIGLLGLLGFSMPAMAQSGWSQVVEQADNWLADYQQWRYPPFVGTVISVYDGDTMRVQDNNGLVHKIRMAFIDAPEIGQAYGIHSRDGLRNIALGQPVAVSVFEKDRYGREVAQVFLGNEDLSLWQIQQGAAWHYRSLAKKKQNSAAYSRYRLAEVVAQQQRLGLWRNSSAEAPWQFRRKHLPQRQSARY